MQHTYRPFINDVGSKSQSVEINFNDPFKPNYFPVTMHELEKGYMSIEDVESMFNSPQQVKIMQQSLEVRKLEIELSAK